MAVQAASFEILALDDISERFLAMPPLALSSSLTAVIYLSGVQMKAPNVRRNVEEQRTRLVRAAFRAI